MIGRDVAKEKGRTTRPSSSLRIGVHKAVICHVIKFPIMNFAGTLVAKLVILSLLLTTTSTVQAALFWQCPVSCPYIKSVYTLRMAVLPQSRVATLGSPVTCRMVGLPVSVL